MARVKQTLYDVYVTSVETDIVPSGRITKIEDAYEVEEADIISTITAIMGHMTQLAHVLNISVVQHPKWVEETPGS